MRFLPVLALGLLPTLAGAAPSFRCDGDPAVAVLAHAIWDAAIHCTGYQPPDTAPIVSITVADEVPGWLGGYAQFSYRWAYGDSAANDARFDGVVIERSATELLLAHELAHAWFHASIPGTHESDIILEVRADLLARCVGRRVPLAGDDGSSGNLPRMVRLGAEPPTAKQAGQTGRHAEHVHLDTRRAVLRLLTAIAAEYGDEQVVLGAEGPRSWSDVEKLLRSTAPAFPWREILALPVDEQRRLLTWGADAFADSAQAAAELSRWRRLEHCAGRAPVSHGWPVMADCSVDRPDSTHRAAHAWFTGGNVSLQEALVEALAQCADSDRQTHMSLASAISDLDILPLLVVDESPSWADVLTKAAGTHHGVEHDLLLEAAGEHAFHLDVDRDGLPTVAEWDRETNPWLWDSDGDGWWDGYDGPRRGVALPVSGVPVCLATREKTWRLDPRLIDRHLGEVVAIVDGARGHPPVTVPAESTAALFLRSHGSSVAGGARVAGVRRLRTVPCSE